jgi:transposase
MIGKNSGQIDIFNSMIYEKLIPKDHLLVKIDSVIDFSFVYDITKDSYNAKIGRKSDDAVVLFKLMLLEYLYKLSDGDVEKRATTDVAFRWFLGLTLDDEIPDSTTISYFRIHRLGTKGSESVFNDIVRKCIEKNLVGKRRYLADSTDVAANVNYPSIRKLICNAFRKVIKEIGKFDEKLADESLKAFEDEIDFEYEKVDKVPVSKYCEIAKGYVDSLYLKTYDELQNNEKYIEVYSVFWDIVEQYSNPNSKDRIISTVDPDARVAHKSPGVRKRGYKNNIIVDEDSEIILASTQKPFNVGDEKELIELIKKTEENFELKPEEITTDRVYGTTENRAYLKDNGIKSNIGFYDNSDKEYKVFPLTKFDISEDLKSAKCPDGKISTKCTVSEASDETTLKFDKETCMNCPLKDQCLSKKDSKSGRRLILSTRYDAIIKDMHNSSTVEFKIAEGKRYIVERRFATQVLNHGLRRCRYLRLDGAKIHITMANIASNVVRMVNLLFKDQHPSLAM